MIGSISSIQFAQPSRAAAAGAVAASEPETYGARSGDSGFEVFAKRYDIHAMTPSEIDEMAAAMPIETAGDLEAKMMLLTRGEEWLTHLAEVSEEATGVDQAEALAARLGESVDLIEDFTAALETAERRGDPTEALEQTLAYLQRMDARRYLPEGGVTV